MPLPIVALPVNTRESACRIIHLQSECEPRVRWEEAGRERGTAFFSLTDAFS